MYFLTVVKNIRKAFYFFAVLFPFLLRIDRFFTRLWRLVADKLEKRSPGPVPTQVKQVFQRFWFRDYRKKALAYTGLDDFNITFIRLPFLTVFAYLLLVVWRALSPAGAVGPATVVFALAVSLALALLLLGSGLGPVWCYGCILFYCLYLAVIFMVDTHLAPLRMLLLGLCVVITVPRRYKQYMAVELAHGFLLSLIVYKFFLQRHLSGAGHHGAVFLGFVLITLALYALYRCSWWPLSTQRAALYATLALFAMIMTGSRYAEAFAAFFTLSTAYLWLIFYYIGIGIIFKILKNSNALHNAMVDVRPFYWLKYVLFVFMGLVCLWLFALDVSLLAPAGYIQAAFVHLAHLQLALQGSSTMALLLVPLFRWLLLGAWCFLLWALLWRRFSNSLASRILYMVIVAYFCMYYYFKQNLFFNHQLENVPVAMLLFFAVTFIWVLITVGRYVCFDSSAAFPQHARAVLYSAILLLVASALVFNLLRGNTHYLKELYFYNYKGIIDVGLPYVLLIFLEKKQYALRCKESHLAAVFFLGILLSLVINFCDNLLVSFGSLRGLLERISSNFSRLIADQPLRYTDAYANFFFIALRTCLVLALLYLSVRLVQRLFAGRDSQREAMVVLWLGAASFVKAAHINVPFVPIRYEALFHPVVHKLTIDVEFLLFYVIFLIPALVLVPRPKHAWLAAARWPLVAAYLLLYNRMLYQMPARFQAMGARAPLVVLPLLLLLAGYVLVTVRHIRDRLFYLLPVSALCLLALFALIGGIHRYGPAAIQSPHLPHPVQASHGLLRSWQTGSLWLRQEPWQPASALSGEDQLLDRLSLLPECRLISVHPVHRGKNTAGRVICFQFQQHGRSPWVLSYAFWQGNRLYAFYLQDNADTVLRLLPDFLDLAAGLKSGV